MQEPGGKIQDKVCSTFVQGTRRYREGNQLVIAVKEVHGQKILEQHLLPFCFHLGNLPNYAKFFCNSPDLLLDQHGELQTHLRFQKNIPHDFMS